MHLVTCNMSLIKILLYIFDIKLYFLDPKLATYTKIHPSWNLTNSGGSDYKVKGGQFFCKKIKRGHKKIKGGQFQFYNLKICIILKKKYLRGVSCPLLPLLRSASASTWFWTNMLLIYGVSKYLLEFWCFVLITCTLFFGGSVESKS